MGSAIGNKLRKALAMLISVCMVVSLNPASALGQTAKAEELYPGAVSDGVSSTYDPETGVTSSSVSTAINVAILSDFKVSVSPTGIVGGLADFDRNNVLTYTVTKPLGECTYKLAFEVKTPEGEWQEVWSNSNPDFEKTVVDADTFTLAFSIASDKNTVSDGRAYRYVLNATDESDITRTATTDVLITDNYEYMTVSDSSNPGVDVSGYMLKGQSGNPASGATALSAPAASNAIKNELNRTVEDGFAIKSAYDLAITNERATAELPAYLTEPALSIQFALDDAVASKDDVIVYTTEGGKVVAIDKDRISLSEDKKTVIVSGVTTLGPWAVALKADPAKMISVTSKVAEGSENYGTMDVIETDKQYAPGTSLRYTFLPFDGCKFKQVTVVYTKANGSSSTSVTTADQLSDENGKLILNYLDILLPSDNTKKVVITAEFERIDTEDATSTYKVTANAIGQNGANGTVKIDSDYAQTDTTDAALPYGSQVKVYFTPDATSTLDRAEIIAGGKVYDASVLGNTVTATLSEPIVAKTDPVNSSITVNVYFKLGTFKEPVVCKVSYEPADVFTANPSEIGYGESFKVNLFAPAANKEIKRVYFTDDKGIEHEMPYLGGTVSASGNTLEVYAANYVFSDITVHAVIGDIEAPPVPETITTTINVPATGGVVTASYKDKSGVEHPLSIPADGKVRVPKDSTIIVRAAPASTTHIMGNVSVEGAPSGTITKTSAEGVSPHVYEIVANNVEDKVINVTFTEIGSGPDPSDNPTFDVAIEGQGYIEVISGTVEDNGIKLPTSTTGIAFAKDPGVVKLKVIKADAGQTVTVTLDGASISADTGTTDTYTLNNPTDKTFKVVFSAIPPKTYDGITGAVQGDFGTIDPVGPVSFTNDGTKAGIQFTASAPQGYELDWFAVTGHERTDEATALTQQTIYAADTNKYTQSGQNYYYTLTATDIVKGYDHVVVKFKKASTGYFTVTPILLNADGTENTSFENDYMRISPASSIEVPRGGAASFSFIAKEGRPGNFIVQTSLVKAAYDDKNAWTTVNGSSTKVWPTDSDVNLYIKVVPESSGSVEKNTHRIYVSATEGGTVSPSGVAPAPGRAAYVEVTESASPAFTFKPVSDQYVLKQIIVDDAVKDGSDTIQFTGKKTYISADDLKKTNGQYTFHHVGAAHSIHAVFMNKNENSDLVEYTVTGGINGTVNPTGKVNASISNAGKPGENQVAIKADAGYVIDTITLNGRPVNISDATGPYTGDATSGTITLPVTDASGNTLAHGTLSVTFKKAPEKVSLIVTSGEGGKVTPFGATSITRGETQTITCIPSLPKYDLEHIWLVDENGRMLKDLTQKGVYSYDILMDSTKRIDVAFCDVSETGDSGAKDKVSYNLNISKVGKGTVDPSGLQSIYSDGGLTLDIEADSNWEIDSITIGGKDVEASLSDGTLRIKGEDILNGVYGSISKNDTLDVKITFKEKSPDVVSVKFTSSNGGTIDPEGSQQYEVGDKVPVTLTPAKGKKVQGYEITYRNADGTTSTDTVYTDSRTPSITITKNMVEVKGLFEDDPNYNPENPGVDPVEYKYSVEVEVGSGGKVNSIEQGRTENITITAPGSKLFKFYPNENKQVDRVVLYMNGNPIEGCTWEGITERNLSYTELQALAGSDNNPKFKLAVTFKDKQTKADDLLDINVDVEVAIDVDVDIDVDVSTIDPNKFVKGGASVSPQHLKLKKGWPYPSEFTVFPYEGYVMTDLKIVIGENGDEEDLPFTYIDKSGKLQNDGVVFDVSAHGKSRAGSLKVPASSSNDGANATSSLTGADRYYTFTLENIDTDVSIFAKLIPLKNPADDNACKGNGEVVRVNVGSSDGGSVSPEGALRFNENDKYTFSVMPDEGYKASYVVLTKIVNGQVVREYINDKETIDKINAEGAYEVTMIKGLTGIEFGFEEDEAALGYVTVDVSDNSGAMSGGHRIQSYISPKGSVNVWNKDPMVEFTFVYEDEHSFLESLTIDGMEVRGLSKTEPTFNYVNPKAGAKVVATFGWDVNFTNKNFNRESYVDVVSRAIGEGTITPASNTVLKGNNSTTFTMIPNSSAYTLVSVSVESAGRIQNYSAAEIKAMYGTTCMFTLENVEATTSVTAKFESKTYDVYITADEGGDVRPRSTDGKPYTLVRGETLTLLVTPDESHEHAGFNVTGPVFAKSTPVAQAAEQVEGQVASRAVGSSFEVIGDNGHIHTLFSEKPVVDDPNKDPSKDPSQNQPQKPVVESATIVASSAGHGAISPEGEQTLPVGTELTFTLTPDKGYQPSYIRIIKADGTEQTTQFKSTTYRMTLTEDCELVAGFEVIAVPGANDPVAKTLRTLTSLAQTGDFNLPAILVLMTVACGSLGVAILTSGRSRRRSERAAHAE